MPLSQEQRHKLNLYIRSNTIYHGVILALNQEPSYTERSHIIDSIEMAMDTVSESFHCDLFLPNCFINQHNKEEFWSRISSIMASPYVVKNWYAMEFGEALNSADKKKKYVYTWSFRPDEIYKFYTKILNDGYNPELVWYIAKNNNDNDEDEDDINSDDSDTENEEIRVYEI